MEAARGAMGCECLGVLKSLVQIQSIPISHCPQLMAQPPPRRLSRQDRTQEQRPKQTRPHGTSGQRAFRGWEGSLWRRVLREPEEELVGHLSSFWRPPVPAGNRPPAQQHRRCPVARHPGAGPFAFEVVCSSVLPALSSQPRCEPQADQELETQRAPVEGRPLHSQMGGAGFLAP